MSCSICNTPELRREKMAKFMSDVRRGLYNIQVTSSGREIKKPQRYQEIKFAKGSGAVAKKGFEETDMTFKAY